MCRKIGGRSTPGKAGIAATIKHKPLLFRNVQRVFPIKVETARLAVFTFAQSTDEIPGKLV